MICGVDVSKAWLDAWIEPGGHQRFANDAAGIAQLASWASKHGADMVAMEASGGIEQTAFLALAHAGIACALANPRHVRRYAEAMGKLEKTDRIDAEMIAQFAKARKLPPTPPPSPQQQRLTALFAHLRQVTADLSVQKRRLHTTRDDFALEHRHATIALLTRQAKATAAEIAKLVEKDPLWTALDRALRSVKGVADRTVAVLLAEMPEIGISPNKQITKLAGLAPIANDSGKRSGKRPIRGGRANVRSTLYLVADIARKYDQSLADFRQRLLDQGKPKMVVRIALARKLLVRLNAKARDARQQLTT